LHAAFSEDQVYRIDHYLGKRRPDVLALRFANAIFEPSGIAVTSTMCRSPVAESLGVGHRGGSTKPPGSARHRAEHMNASDGHHLHGALYWRRPRHRDEKVKVLRAVDIPDIDEVVTQIVRGQYERGWVEGEEVPSYREEEGVAADSQTDTYVALRLTIDKLAVGWGALLLAHRQAAAEAVDRVALQFKPCPPPFAARRPVAYTPTPWCAHPADEGITLRSAPRLPGQAFEVRDVLMDFSYGAPSWKSAEALNACSSMRWPATQPCSSVLTRSSRPGRSWSRSSRHAGSPKCLWLVIRLGRGVPKQLTASFAQDGRGMADTLTPRPAGARARTWRAGNVEGRGVRMSEVLSALDDLPSDATTPPPAPLSSP